MFIRCVISAVLPRLPMFCIAILSSSSSAVKRLPCLCLGLPPWRFRGAGWRDDALLPLTARALLKNCCVCEVAGETWLELLEMALLEVAAAFDEAGGWLMFGGRADAAYSGIGGTYSLKRGDRCFLCRAEGRMIVLDVLLRCCERIEIPEGV